MISIASSIRFRKADGLLPSFDNTMFEDETHFRIAKHRYYHKFYDDDVVTIQAELDTGQLMEMQYSEATIKNPGVLSWGDWQSMTGEALVFSGAFYDYREIDIDFSDFSKTIIKFRAVILESETVVETWYSEPCEIIEPNDQYLLLEYFSLENDFNVYYTNPTPADAISHQLRIRARLRKYKPGGESSVFDNQNEVVKTSDEVKRILTLETEAIPNYLAEMIAVALAHDKFFINQVEFVAEGKPEFESSGGDLTSLTVALTQRDVIGLNSHDIGYNCDSVTNSDMIVLQELAASGQKSFPITDDYMILTITGIRVAGDPVLKAGYTPGGDEILADMSLSVSNPTEVALIPYDKSSVTGGTMYVEVSGVGATANIHILTVKNRQ